MWKCRGRHCGHHGLMKLSLVAFVLFVLQVWPAAMNLVHKIHWGWFLAVAILFALMPMKHMWMDKMKMMQMQEMPKKKRGRRR